MKSTLSEPGRPCLCGALDCRSCGPAQGYPLDYDNEDDGGDADDYWQRKKDEDLMARDEVLS